ncbi:MAG TPA: bifunctional phosphopantothenoylcysteine decarboxylase/phosphopantothenate--cysteine ligase CoaBC [Acidimicrobiales bacterium]|nr:bifunctional phosphopantothenoylcysteine decarboxylase/phosphopantothenate--cysteine ligase CoaBC [Acidimicrobiales bacterium]
MPPEPSLSPLAGRRIVLGVCGSIAAYKAADLCRRLVDAGAHVSPVMTAGATRFLGTVTLSALASDPVRTSLWDELEPAPHISLARSADVIVVAPATTRVIAAYAGGLSDDLLTAILLATKTSTPVVVCPAMHTEMWEHPATVDNVALLRRRGVHVLEPAVGALAGGDIGVGRMPEPIDIVAAIARIVGDVPRLAQDLAGLRVLVTAGGTREAVDAVRFIANRSSGKQGHALAEVAAARGASVTLITGVALPVPAGVAEVVAVETAADMEHEVLTRAADADVVIMAAAVADFRPKAPPATKLKKADGTPEIVLEPTTDILATLGRSRHQRPAQVLVGFAAESAGGASVLQEEAARKLVEKGADLIVANDISAPGAGFGHDTNEVLLVGAGGSEQTVALTDKREVAARVLDAVVALLRKRNS